MRRYWTTSGRGLLFPAWRMSGYCPLPGRLLSYTSKAYPTIINYFIVTLKLHLWSDECVRFYCFNYVQKFISAYRRDRNNVLYSQLCSGFTNSFYNKTWTKPPASFITYKLSIGRLMTSQMKSAGAVDNTRKPGPCSPESVAAVVACAVTRSAVWKSRSVFVRSRSRRRLLRE